MENNGILKSFDLQDDLNPKIWKKNSKGSYTLSPEVREKLLEIAYEFIESLKVDVIVSDVHLTGSLVNFNWSQYSDFDLHIIADFNQFPKKSLPLYEELFKLKKTIFNSEQNIKIYGYDVEVFVQDENEKGHSAGIFSLISNDWLEKPKKEKFEVNKTILKKKIDQWTEKIDKVLESAQEEKDLEKSKKIIDNLKTKIKEYRKIGLEKGGEMSYENLVFKYLRRSGHIEKLFSFKKERLDKELSLKEKLSINESTITLGGTFQTDLDNGPKNHKTRALGNWQSDNAWDVFAPPGTNVNSYTNGTVYKVRDTGRNSGKVYGTQVTVTGDKGFPDIFYTHLKNVKLRVGDKVQIGDYIGEISEWIDHKGGEHVHIGLPYGNHLRSLLVNSNKIFTGRGPTSLPDESKKTEQKTLNIPSGKFLNPLGNQRYTLTSEFGVRRQGYNHAGADMALPSGSNLYSPGDGVVIDAKIRNDACGGTLFIDHQNGFRSRFCHLKQINVSKGDEVNAGQLVGLTGGGLNDVGHGSTTGPHLHFEFYKNGKLVNGIDYIYTPNFDISGNNTGFKPSQGADMGNKKEQPLSFFEQILAIIFGDIFFKKDDPKKSDHLKADVKDFYNTLDSIPTKLSKMDEGELNFQKNVEALQIGLSLLGYEFSNFGIDGLYGPETSKNVKQFKLDNKLEKEEEVDGEFITSEQIDKLIDLLKTKNISNEDIKNYIDKPDFSKVNLSKGDVATSKEIIDFFVGKGLSVEQSAGIAGNLFAESSFKTNIWGDNNTSFGLAQWHAERMNKLFKWTKSNGYDVNSIEGQLEYLWHELQTNESAALNYLKKTTTAGDAASTFAAKFERPASSNYSKRVQNAENFYRSYNQST